MIYDAIVIGVGGMGSAALYHLAKKGVSVLGIEQFDTPHTMGSSHGHTRVIRKAYFEHPSYVPMLEKAFQLWDELKEESDGFISNFCGMIYAGHPNSACIQGVQQSSKQFGIAVERLPYQEMKRAYPMFRLEDGMVGLYEADAGFLFVEECIWKYCEVAKKHGAKLRTNTTVNQWEYKDGVFHVYTKRETYKANSLVVCAGSWTGRILNELHLPLTIQRVPSGWFAVEDRRFYLQHGFPVFGIDTGEGFYYGFPARDDMGFKIAQYEGRETVENVDTVDRQYKEGDLDHVIRFKSRYLPDISDTLVFTSICLYTMTPDQHFIIDRHPHYENLYIAGGFSGHGFKFASVVGSILSEMVVEGKSELDIDFFSLSRFQEKN